MKHIITNFDEFHNEAFGFSKKYKELKLLKEKIQKAKKEIANSKIGDNLTLQPDSSDDQKQKENHIKTILNMIKYDYPTLSELLPNLFDPKQGIGTIITMYKNEKIYSICPSKFYPIINDAGITSNEKELLLQCIKMKKYILSVHQNFIQL